MVNSGTFYQNINGSNQRVCSFFKHSQRAVGPQHEMDPQIHQRAACECGCSLIRCEQYTCMSRCNTSRGRWRHIRRKNFILRARVHLVVKVTNVTLVMTLKSVLIVLRQCNFFFMYHINHLVCCWLIFFWLINHLRFFCLKKQQNLANY